MLSLLHSNAIIIISVIVLVVINLVNNDVMSYAGSAK